MTSPDQRLAELGLELPAIPPLPFTPKLLPVLEHDRLAYVAEGAGAAPVAAAVNGRTDGAKVLCVVSGGNIDASKLARILEGHAMA
jgi:hypothetical protein